MLVARIFEYMNIFRYIIGPAIILALFTACDDDVTTVGNSLVTDKSEVIIDSSFIVTGQSVPNNDIQSRTITQLLGEFNAKEFGSFKSEFVTQFMPALQIDTTNVVELESLRMRLLMFVRTGDFTGDSLVPMGLKIYPLIKQLPSPIYSNFDPTDYYNEGDCWTPESHIYTANALYSDSANALAYRTVSVELPYQFARMFYEKYRTSPQTFASPQAFAEFFPGIYVKSSFGSGRVININETRINLYYRRKGTVSTGGTTRDTVYNATGIYMAVTPEVISNNIINFQISPQLAGMVSNGENIIVAPSGYDSRLTFPTKEIIEKYRSQAGDLSVVNKLTFSIPVSEIENDYNITPPAYLLMILSNKKKEFFAQNKVSDDRTSFLASYDSENKRYDFTGLRDYIMDMLAKENLEEDDYTFTLTPVDVVTESASSGYYNQGETVITGINPYVGKPAMCRLDMENAKIKFTYSKQSINN